MATSCTRRTRRRTAPTRSPKVTDGTAASTNSATVTVTITPSNDPPVAVDDTLTTHEGVAKTIDATANDTDLDGVSTLTVASVTQGTVTFNGEHHVHTDGQASSTATDRPCCRVVAGEVFVNLAKSGTLGEPSR
jgi:hypothetical protein